jgi:hypothetical protein
MRKSGVLFVKMQGPPARPRPQGRAGAAASFPPPQSFRRGSTAVPPLTPGHPPLGRAARRVRPPRRPVGPRPPPQVARPWRGDARGAAPRAAPASSSRRRDARVRSGGSGAQSSARQAPAPWRAAASAPCRPGPPGPTPAGGEDPEEWGREE